MALAQVHGEAAAFLHLDRLEDVGHDIQMPVVAHQPRVTVDGEEPRVAAAAGERVQRPAMVPEAGAGFAERHDERLLRHALFNRRQLAGAHLLDERRRLDQRPCRVCQQENKSEQPHARARTR